jgi:hypothetical protein
MRELTGRELDAVCGGLLDFTWGHFSPIKKKIYNPQTNYSEVTQSGFVNVNVNPQTNIGNNVIL